MIIGIRSYVINSIKLKMSIHEIGKITKYQLLREIKL